MDRVYLDTETTGLKYGEAEVCEVAICAADGTELLNTLVKPDIGIPEQATAIHGITEQMVEDAPSWESLQPQIAKVLLGKDLRIYNVDYDAMFFDMKVLHHAAQISCVMKRYAAWDGTPGKFNGWKWHKLVDAAKVAGYQFENAHRAMADAKATAAVDDFLDDQWASDYDQVGYNCDIDALMTAQSALRFNKNNPALVEEIEQYLKFRDRFSEQNYVKPNNWHNDLLKIPF